MMCLFINFTRFAKYFSFMAHRNAWTWARDETDASEHSWFGKGVTVQHSNKDQLWWVFIWDLFQNHTHRVLPSNQNDISHGLLPCLCLKSGDIREGGQGLWSYLGGCFIATSQHTLQPWDLLPTLFSRRVLVTCAPGHPGKEVTSADPPVCSIFPFPSMSCVFNPADPSACTLEDTQPSGPSPDPLSCMKPSLLPSPNKCWCFFSCASLINSYRPQDRTDLFSFFWMYLLFYMISFLWREVYFLNFDFFNAHRSDRVCMLKTLHWTEE